MTATAVHYGHVSALGTRTAAREVLIATAMTTIADPLLAFRGADRENLDRGVRYRLLVPDRARLTPEIGRRLDAFTRHGAEIRTVAAVPMAAVVVDGALALLPDDHRGELTAFRLPSVVTTVVGLFDRLWPAATPLTGAARGGCGPTGRELDLLALLSDGYTDESAAARLGISVRTVRRMVSDLMHRLGARSRFQAGAKAEEAGWLLELTG
ncbi:helix-turn-helix transcriptional regulator [Amycolatopsis sp. OK19-0408]|uniref:Helix-turn-helix transcriptional regulator n=1 Tax=Amycolatopsis iheyensis TaxID=2945988 RepID=A0A9X2NKS8_9PSEU|nr:helix-turn-helix transcriptional regulator [Amycolatopsis iheyensis]MCR6489627.1 helix-turn-helix transcriptional regulator [Amycolatopsis iheyensis]